VNGLSRRSDWKVGVEKNNEKWTLVKKEWLEAQAVEVSEVVIDRVDILDKIRKSKAKDDEVIKAVKEIKCIGVKVLRNEEWREYEGLMLKKGKVYVSKNKKLRAEVIRLYHDTPVEEHRGQWKTTELVTRNFWWLGISKEVKRYIEECDTYQRNKNHTQAPASRLMPNLIPEKPWSYISADFIMKLSLAQEYNSILVVVDKLTKIAHFISITEKTTVGGLARLFRDNIWKLYGITPDN